MAAGKSILKLVVDDKEYGSKLKNAQNALNALEAVLQGTGKSFAQVDKAVVDYAKSIGQMSTQATTARGKIGEMTSTFTELSLKYRQLTDDEKKSPFGQALSASLDQLRTRIQDSRQQLDDVTRSLSDTKQEGGATSGIMEQLAGKFTISLDAVKLFNVGLQATQSVLSVAKDAFFASEANVDEWGRIVDSSKSLYEGFLNSINNGDISGFLGRIDQIVTAARAAYDELDRLGTMKTIQAPAISAQQTENERMRMMIQTGRYIAPTDGRRAAMANGAVLSPDQIKRLEQRLQSGMNNVVKLVGNEVKQTSKAIDAIYNRQAKEIGMSVSEFRRGTSSMAEFDRRIEGARNYRQWQQDHSYVDQSTGRLVAPRTGNPYAQFKGWDVFRVDGQRYNDLVQLIRQRDQQAGQSYSMQSQAYRTMNRAEGITLRQIMGGTGGSGGGKGGGNTTKQEIEAVSGSIDYQAKKVQELQKAWRAAADDSAREDYRKQIEEAQFVLDKMMGKTSGIPQMNYGLGDLAGKNGSGVYQGGFELAKNDSKNPWKLDDKAMKALGDEIARVNEKREVSLTKEIGNIAGGVSNIMGGIESLGIDLPQGMRDVVNGIQGVISILTGISSIITAIQTISTANLFKLAGGGVVRAASGFVSGNNFSGDMVPALLNSGEVVLNRAQQGNLVSQLSDSQRTPGPQLAQVSGEQIYIAMSNYLRRSGKGEMVTWR